MKINADLEKEHKSWISLTGYRTLFVLKLLLEKPRTIDELISELSQNKNTQKSLSKDTVRITLKTLKSAGCVFAKSSKTNGYKYEILSHPFNLELSNEEIDSLIKVRNKASFDLSWQDVFALNKLYEKIIFLTKNKEKIELVKSTEPLFDVDKDVLAQLSSPNIFGKKIQIKYYSPTNGEEIFDIVVGKISYNDGKLYLHCFNYKYNSNSLLNVERIKEIQTVYLSQTLQENYLYEVVYELFGESKCNFEKKDFETILEENEEKLIVKACVNNEFCFVQRLLLFGADFKIISPDSFREKLINKIKLIQKGYENEKI